MFIKEFRIKNFRNFDDAGVLLKFHQGVNAIVGENNAGKSAIISAIRIAVSIIQYKKDIYFTKSDFHLDAKGVLANEAQFDIYLADVPKYLIEIWKPGTDEGEFHIRFFLTKNEAGKERIKYSVWGGEAEGNQLSADTLEAINLVYLGALRDAENEMRPNRNSKIANLLGALAATPELKEDLVNELVKANKALLQKEPISKIREIINRNLVSIEHDVLHQQIDIGFIDPKFDSIAASLRTWILPRWSFVDKTSKYFTRIKERCSIHKDLVDEDAEGIFLDVKKYSEPKNSVDGAMSKNHIQSQMDFINGRGAMIPNGAWIEYEMRNSAPEGFSMKLMPTPFIDNDHKVRMNWTASGDFAIIPKDIPEANKQLAKDFLLFLAREDQLQAYTKTTGSPRGFYYDLDSIVKDLTPFAQSVVNNYKNSVNIYMYSNNPLYYKNLANSWPASGSPYGLIADGESARSVYQMEIDKAKSEWDTWLSQVQ